MTRISNYDECSYDYKDYWTSRKYEDKAEKIVLEKYFKNLNGKFCLDIGGSFGRNLPVYYEKYETPIILDYSLKTLQKNKSAILDKYPKTKLIAANAYHIPFKDASIDTSVLVRVLHHIQEQNDFFQEVKRITKKYFILEYANKIHLKAILKWLLTLKFKNFSTKPYQQPSQGNYEGVKKDEDTVFLNYHPKYIKEILSKYDFKILRKTNCSFLRMNFFKKLLPLSFLIMKEKAFQICFSWTNIAPSIILKTLQTKSKKQNFDIFEDILCCAKCKGDLEFKGKIAYCKSCKISFEKKDGIWDFRI
jgi:ubiquinone/menaquinone biosynthesis C-methylase UbiE